MEMRMRAVRLLVVSALAFVVLAAPAVVLVDGRVALVVGNSTYAHIGRLPNPDNDARDMSAALRRLGFEVTTEFDADRAELTEALRRFTWQSAGADVSLVFYAGHGIEMDGVNYLVPVDARLERDVDVRFETVTVDDLLVSTLGASLRLVILDVCRNNLSIAVRPSRDTLSDSTTSVSGTAMVAACRRTTAQPSNGSSGRPNKGTPRRRATSASCTGAVAARGRTTPNPSGGTAARRNRGTRAGRTTSAGCTRPVGACSKTTPKLSAGTTAQSDQGDVLAQSNLWNRA